MKAVTGSRKVKDVVADLLAARAADGMSPRYLGDLRVRLGRFALSFGEEMIARISASQIDLWLRGLVSVRLHATRSAGFLSAFQLRQTPWLRS